MRAWNEIEQPFFGSVALAEQANATISGGLNFTKPQIINGYFGVNLIQGDKNAFLVKLKKICANLGIPNINWLLVTMWKESTIQAQAINPTTKAVGLIQWMPKTLAAWGLTTNQVYAMNNLQQLDLVYKYFLPYKGKFKDFPIIYLTVFFPAAINKPANWPFAVNGGASAKKVRDTNPGIDVNKDGVIDKTDFYKYVYKNLSNDALELVGNNEDNNLPGVEVIAKPTYYTFAAIMAILGIAAYTTTGNGKRA